MRTPTMGAFGDGASDAPVRTGGYKIRPYGPASGFLVTGEALHPLKVNFQKPAGAIRIPSPARRGTLL